jgi:hypothetical protein
METKIKITTVLIPFFGEKKGVPQPIIDGMECITSSQVEIDGEEYDKFEYIPNYIDLCNGGNAERVGDYLIIKSDEGQEN